MRLEASWVIIMTGEPCFLAVSVPKSYPGHTPSPLVHLIRLCLPLTCTLPLRIIPSLFQWQCKVWMRLFLPDTSRGHRKCSFPTLLEWTWRKFCLSSEPLHLASILITYCPLSYVLFPSLPAFTHLPVGTRTCNTLPWASLHLFSFVVW